MKIELPYCCERSKKQPCLVFEHSSSFYDSIWLIPKEESEGEVWGVEAGSLCPDQGEHDYGICCPWCHRDLESALPKEFVERLKAYYNYVYSGSANGEFNTEDKTVLEETGQK